MDGLLGPARLGSASRIVRVPRSDLPVATGAEICDKVRGRSPRSTSNGARNEGAHPGHSLVRDPHITPSISSLSGSLAASLIGRLGSSTFRLSTASVSMSLTGSCFSSESAPRPFHHGIRGRGGTIYRAALPSHGRQVQATKRTHLIHRPVRDILPPQGGTRVSSYRI